MNWQDDAACAEVDGDLFFPDSGRVSKAIREFCSVCPVTLECLTAAMDGDVQVGIWGGLDSGQRQQLKKGLAS